MVLRLPAFCEAIPWKLGSVAVGIVMLVFSTMYFLDSLVISIMYSGTEYNEHGEAISTDQEKAFVGFLKTLAFEYGATLQITFSLILIYGSLMEKSAFTFSWLIVQIAIMINASLYLKYIIVEDYIILGILVLAMLGVFKFYTDLPKTQVV